MSAESPNQTVTVRNTYSQPGTGNLQIKKAVTGSAGETQRDFTFTVTLTDANGSALPGTYGYSGSKEGTITSGGTITLKHNESVTISNLPEAARYQVAEQEANTDRYTTTLEGGEGSDQGVIPVGGTAVVSYVNSRTTRRSGGGGGTPNPGPRPEPETPPTPETSPTPENPTEPGTPPVLPELPNPNDPNSPDVVIIIENGVPTTYVKVQNPETGELMYIPEEDVPLFGLPKTGDENRRRWLEMMAVISALGIGTLTMNERRKRKKEERQD